VTGATGGAKADVTNSKGDITSTLSGAAAAVIDYAAGTNAAGSYGTVNLTASSLTGGLTSTITSNMASTTGASTINLGALSSSTVNSITLAGYVATTTVNGSSGKDTVINSAGGDTLGVTNANDTYAGNSGTDTLSYAGNTHDANSGTSGAGATTDGYAMNFTSNTITFDNTPVTSATNITTLAAGKVAQYDSTAVSSTSTTAGNIVAGGEMDTVSGFESVIGSGKNDYIALANTGMTVQGGAGDDKIVLNAGSDTVSFESTAAGNGADTITSFTVGSTNGDILDFDAFITGGVYNSLTAVAGTSTAAVALSNVSGKLATVSVADVTADGFTTEASFFAASKAFAAEGTTAYSMVFLVGETSGTDGVKAYYVTDGTGADDMAITLVGTLSGISLSGLVTGNLDVA
jgi:hypothetical protein